MAEHDPARRPADFPLQLRTARDLFEFFHFFLSNSAARERTNSMKRSSGA
jgi:hypothetical protein